jgi:hypothetical protein
LGNRVLEVLIGTVVIAVPVLILAQVIEMMGGNMPVGARIALIGLGWFVVLAYALRSR